MASGSLNCFAIPARDAYHNAHADDCFEEVILLVLPYQSAGGSLERAGYYPHLFAYHGFGFALAHEDGGFVLWVAKHAKLYHVDGRNFAKYFFAWVTENADWNAAFIHFFDECLLTILSLYKQKIVDCRNQYPLRLIFALLRIVSHHHWYKMYVSFLRQKVADFSFLAVKRTNGVPWLVGR